MRVAPAPKDDDEMTQTDERSIRIGPQFFQNALRDYSNRHWAFVREMLQNSIDAGATKIDLGISNKGPVTNTVFSCVDNGCGMDRSTIENKLLVLGESGKNFATGKTGGFGKAKEILYFCHEQYQIYTHDLALEGSGATYRLQEHERWVDGTTSIVEWKGDQLAELVKYTEWFARLLNWSGTLTLNGNVLTTNHPNGAFRRKLTSGDVFTNDLTTERLVVRMHGIPMFTRTIKFERCVVVELDAQSVDRLTANRDSLLYSMQEEIDEFCEALATNRLKAFGKPKVAYHRWNGKRLRYEKPNAGDHETEEVVSPAKIKQLTPEQTRLVIEAIVAKMAQPATRPLETAEDVTEDVTTPDSGMGFPFVIKNTTGLVIPDYYQPGIIFSAYSQKVTRTWVSALLEIHRMMDDDRPFNVGFIFDETAQALYEQDSDGYNLFLISPAEVVQQTNSISRSFKARFSNVQLAADHIIAVALHEYCHSVAGSYHDEGYANRLTELTSLLLGQYKDIRKVVR